ASRRRLSQRLSRSSPTVCDRTPRGTDGCVSSDFLMNTTRPHPSRRFGQRLISHARALLAVSALAALVLPRVSLAQSPTFNALVQTPVNVGSGFPDDATVGDINGDGKLEAMIPGINGLRVLLGNGDGTCVDQGLGLADVTTSNVVNLHPS